VVFWLRWVFPFSGRVAAVVHIFYLVFSQLAVGGMSLLLFTPKYLVGRGFYRLMGGIYLLVAALARCANLAINSQPITWRNFAFAAQGQDGLFTLVFFYLLLLYMSSLWLRPSIAHRFLLIAGAVFGGVWIVLSAEPYLGRVNLPAERFLLPAQFLVSSALLGAVNSGMWFGHWYLVTPNLPVLYLKRFNRIYLIALLLSIAFFALNVFFWSQTAAANPLNFFHQLIFWLRALLGLGGSLFMYIIIWHCLRDKAVERDVVGATRAATGFLYLAMLTVFMGELFGRLLLLEARFIL
jgi:hypothetical protein